VNYKSLALLNAEMIQDHQRVTQAAISSASHTKGCTRLMNRTVPSLPEQEAD
jgi:hypothetical protein